MKDSEEVFKNVCSLLEDNEINYWVCHGTLLGIIRERRLLPWDHDIDFAVWDSEVSKGKIINIFSAAGYRQEVVFGDMDCLHFIGGDKKIDISFYKRHGGVASIKWVAPSRSSFVSVCAGCVQIICFDHNNIEIEFSRHWVKRMVHMFLVWFSLLLRNLLSSRIKKILYQFMMRRLTYRGYSYPVGLMLFKSVEYNGFFIPIPVDSVKCLEMTYGKDWDIPNKNYVWYEEANNLMDL